MSPGGDLKACRQIEDTAATITLLRFVGLRHKANTLERNSFQDQFPRAPSLLPFHHPRARLQPSPLRAQPCCGSAGASPSRYGPQAGHQFTAGCPRRPRSSWLTAWCVVRHCHVAHVEPRVPSPLTPGPSPLPGARGAMRAFQCNSKTQIPPLAPGTGERGRG